MGIIDKAMQRITGKDAAERQNERTIRNLKMQEIEAIAKEERFRQAKNIAVAREKAIADAQILKIKQKYSQQPARVSSGLIGGFFPQPAQFNVNPSRRIPARVPSRRIKHKRGRSRPVRRSMPIIQKQRRFDVISGQWV